MYRFLAATAALILTAVNGVAGEPAAADQLVALLAPTKSLHARFDQQVSDARGDLLQRSSGELWVKRPSRLRWEVRQPFAYLVVTDGRWLWRYDADLEQAVRQPFNGNLAQTPALLFSDDPEALDEHYDITLAAGDWGQRFVLVPRSADSAFSQLEVVFKAREMQRMVLLDGLGQTTDIRFSAVRANPAVDDARFHFTPPAGTDVIYDDPQPVR